MLPSLGVEKKEEKKRERGGWKVCGGSVKGL